MTETERTETIIAVLADAFADLSTSDPDAFRVKYRKMAADPFAFYRGTACLFYRDVTSVQDEWVDEQSGRIWIHGDLHAENFGTYLNSAGRLVFDINDFDEAYVGHFTWDLRRFAASLALIGWQKALPEAHVRELIASYLTGYLDQVEHYTHTPDDDFALHLGNTDGPVNAILGKARARSRVSLLDSMTELDGIHRHFTDTSDVRRLNDAEHRQVEEAFAGYVGSIPDGKRMQREVFYEVRDIVGKSGFGIGSAGLPAFNVLVEGYSEALDNDVVLSMKQANVPAVSRFAGQDDVSSYFDHEGHRTVVSQRALQAHTDPLLGYTTIDGVGYVVSEVSPYEIDLEWGELNEPDVIASVVELLGRATAKVHCASDEDSDQTLVNFQVEEAIVTSLEGRHDEFIADIAEFAVDYAAIVRADHALFVEAFREGRVGVDATR